MGAACCPGCKNQVALHEGRPYVGAGGAVELWHPRCFETRGEPKPSLDPKPALPALPPRAGHGRKLAVAGIAVVALVAAAGWARADLAGTTMSSLANPVDDVHERLVLSTQLTAHEIAPPSPDLAAAYPVPLVHGVRLDELYPTLKEWAHPITEARQVFPPEACRHFGAQRVGITPRPECGLGHCGVDLDGPRGQPIVAVADGTVVRVEHSLLGLDHRSGRYVRIQHEDGTLTSYMHLDDIAQGLRVGDHVDAGQVIGYLGATACYKAPAHLHFSLEIPNDPTMRGDITDTTYVDPAPFLVRAEVLPVPPDTPPAPPPPTQSPAS